MPCQTVAVGGDSSRCVGVGFAQEGFVASAGFDLHQRNSVCGAGAADTVAVVCGGGIAAQRVDDGVQGGDFAAPFGDGSRLTP